MTARAHVSNADDVANIVRSVRRRQNLTQAQLAQRARVSRQFLIDLEAGHSRAELGKVLSVLSALDLSVDTVPAESAPNPVRLDRKFHISLALHRAVLTHLRSDPEHVLSRGLRGVEARRPHLRGDATDLIDEWRSLLGGKRLALIEHLLTGTDEHSVEMRNVTPFIDVLDQSERDAVLAGEYSERPWER